MANKMSKKNKKQKQDIAEQNAEVSTDMELLKEEAYESDPEKDTGAAEREEANTQTPEDNGAVDTAKDEEKAGNALTPLYLLRLVVVLTCICAVIAGLLAAVNAVTKDVILENAVKAQQEAILAVFPAGNRVEEYRTADEQTVYIVLKDNEILGYTVSVTAGGYVGPVDFMIGLTAEGAVDGIKIVSMGETPGVGTKIAGAAFLEQFIGMDSEVVLGENADAISGATFSSRAVEEAVNTALGVKVDLADAAE
ncbi:MAG: FMN-binding protein, partial [Clostridia bacterium]|nr:FMN-binding protein [Clostridia bacterium]